MIASVVLASTACDDATEQRRALTVSPRVHKPADKVYAPRQFNKVMVLGLDGASWNVIDPMIERGLLPNLEFLIETGTSGSIGNTAGSTFSPVVWTTMFTGVQPNRHGIQGSDTASSTRRRQKALWNLLGERNHRSILLNIPGTFPPEPIVGIEISGFPMKNAFIGDGGGTFIEVTLDDAGVRKGRSSFEVRDDETEETHRFDLEIFARDDEERYTFTLSNEGRPQISTIAPGKPSDWLTFELSPGRRAVTQLVLVDPGPDGPLRLHLAPIRRLPHDDWTYYSPASFADRHPEIRDRYFPHEIMWAKYRDPTGLDLLYRYLHDSERGRVKVGTMLRRNEDWSLFIHVITLPDRVQHAYWPFHAAEDYDMPHADSEERFGDRVEAAYIACDEMVGRYLEEMDPHTTLFVVSDHGFKSQGWKLRYWNRAKRWWAAITGQTYLDSAMDGTVGHHRTEGIYVVKGPAIGAGRIGYARDIADVAPTVLYLLGEPMPEDLDGRIMTDLFETEYLDQFGVATFDGALGRREPIESSEVDESTMEQLRGLGYVE